METETNSEKYLEEVTCEINMKMPSLNDYVRICRANKYEASQYKRQIEHDIGYFIGKLPRFENPVRIRFHWIEGNKKRDLDNIAFSKKFILDALVRYGKLKDDNRKCVVAFEDTFEYSKEFKVIISIKEVTK